MSNYVKFSLAAAMLALRDAGVEDLAAFGESCSAVLGSAHGSVAYCHDYYSQIVREGIAAANPVLFAEGVPNAAAAHLSLAIGIKGGCQTILGSRTAGLDALGLAAARIATGVWDRAIVGAAEEFSPLLNEAYAYCGLHAAQQPADSFDRLKSHDRGTFVTGCGAVMMLLESPQAMRSRGGRALGMITGYSAASPREGRFTEAAADILGDMGNPTTIISSANGTWIDRLEAAAVRFAASRVRRDVGITSLSGHFAETFSVGPLAAVGAGLLRQCPKLYGAAPPGTIAATTIAHDFAVLATDYAGLIAGVRVGLP